MAQKNWTTACAFAMGVLAATTAMTLAGLGKPEAASPAPATAGPNEERTKQLLAQLQAQQDVLDEAKATVDFWTSEGSLREGAMNQTYPTIHNDPVAGSIYEKEKQLFFRSAYCLQDAKLRAALASHKVEAIKSLLGTD